MGDGSTYERWGLTFGSYYDSDPLDVLTDGEPRRVVRRKWIAWTTDQSKIKAATDGGADVRPYLSRDERFTGAEVAVTVERPA